MSTIILSGLNIYNIFKSFDLISISESSNIQDKIDDGENLVEINLQENSFSVNDRKTTLIDELISDINDKSSIGKETVSFLNQIKHPVKCISVSVDVNQYSIPCFWCRHSFDSIPVACPIKYCPHTAVKKYISDITNSSYTIKEKISEEVSQKILSDKKISISPGNYYITDGVFCSFNCCMAFIEDNKHNPLYDNSKMLLVMMYSDMLNDKRKNITIIPAPHWRLLKDIAGGIYDIKKFRENFSKVSYIPHGISIRYLYEENIKL